MDSCRPRLYRELKKIHPNAGLLVMGKWALYALTGKEKGLGSLSGFHINIDIKKIKQLCISHNPKPLPPPKDDDIAF